MTDKELERLIAELRRIAAVWFNDKALLLLEKLIEEVWRSRR